MYSTDLPWMTLVMTIWQWGLTLFASSLSPSMPSHDQYFYLLNFVFRVQFRLWKNLKLCLHSKYFSDSKDYFEIQYPAFLHGWNVSYLLMNIMYYPTQSNNLGVEEQNLFFWKFFRFWTWFWKFWILYHVEASVKMKGFKDQHRRS